MMEAITKNGNKQKKKEKENRNAPLNLAFYDISNSPREILLLSQEEKMTIKISHLSILKTEELRWSKMQRNLQYTV